MKCDICGSLKNKIQTKKETIQVRGDNVSLNSNVRVCECGNELFDDLLEETNLSNVYFEYRKKHNVISLEDIASIRHKYGLSQRSLSKVLGWGEVTLHRYESGALPSLSHSNILKLIEEPEAMKKLLIEAQEKIPKTTFRKSLAIIEQQIKEEDAEQFTKSFKSQIHHSKITIDSGFKQFDLDKFTNAILYFSNTIPLLWKTKLNKLLFFIDFSYFRKYTLSITGAKYIKLDYGPVPDNYEALLWFLEKKNMIYTEYSQAGKNLGTLIKTSNEYNSDAFSAKEFEVMFEVSRDYGKLNATEISKRSHKELAWVETPINKVISYELAMHSENKES